MAVAQFLSLLHATSRSSFLKPTRPFLYYTIKNYGEGRNGNRSRLMEERAPSTAEEFQRVAEEKAKELAKKGILPNQNLNKSYDAAQDANIIGNSKDAFAKNVN